MRSGWYIIAFNIISFMDILSGFFINYALQSVQNILSLAEFAFNNSIINMIYRGYICQNTEETFLQMFYIV